MQFRVRVPGQKQTTPRGALEFHARSRARGRRGAFRRPVHESAGEDRARLAVQRATLAELARREQAQRRRGRRDAARAAALAAEKEKEESSLAAQIASLEAKLAAAVRDTKKNKKEQKVYTKAPRNPDGSVKEWVDGMALCKCKGKGGW